MRREARVNITDLETDEVDTLYLTNGIDSYLVLCGSALMIAYVQEHANGTKVITIKKHEDEEQEQPW